MLVLGPEGVSDPDRQREGVVPGGDARGMWETSTNTVWLKGEVGAWGRWRGWGGVCVKEVLSSSH